jgi:hypothetical protein
MRILFVCAADFSAPSEKQVLGFAQTLVRRGHGVLISIAGDLSTAEAEGTADVPGLQVVRHRLRTWGRNLHDAELLTARTFSPTLIHCFSPRLPVVTAAVAYSRVANAPVVVHYEDDECTTRDSRNHTRHLRYGGRGMSTLLVT